MNETVTPAAELCVGKYSWLGDVVDVIGFGKDGDGTAFSTRQNRIAPAVLDEPQTATFPTHKVSVRSLFVPIAAAGPAAMNGRVPLRC